MAAAPAAVSALAPVLAPVLVLALPLAVSPFRCPQQVQALLRALLLALQLQLAHTSWLSRAASTRLAPGRERFTLHPHFRTRALLPQPPLLATEPPAVEAQAEQTLGQAAPQPLEPLVVSAAAAAVTAGRRAAPLLRLAGRVRTVAMAIRRCRQARRCPEPPPPAQRHLWAWAWVQG